MDLFARQLYPWITQVWGSICGKTHPVLHTDLRVCCDIKARDASFLQRVLLVNNFLIQFQDNLLVHHLLLIMNPLLQGLS